MMPTMPYTPYHIAPGFLFKAILHKHFSLFVFVLAQLIIDIESGYYLLTYQYPYHRLAHTLLGASLIAVFCAIIGVPIGRLFISVWNRLMDYLHQARFSFEPAIPFRSAGLWSESSTTLSCLAPAFCGEASCNCLE